MKLITSILFLFTTSLWSQTEKVVVLPFQLQPPQIGEFLAEIKTNQGSMSFRLFKNQIPMGVNNFIQLAKMGKYKNIPFHRVIKDFMIQGGDFTKKNGTGGYSYKGKGTTISDEYHPDLSHIRGALSYAKTSRPNSIGSQFFIVHPQSGTPQLNHRSEGGSSQGYTVFGQLLFGYDVLDKIANIPTGPRDIPKNPVLILDVVITEVITDINTDANTDVNTVVDTNVNTDVK
jgi:cyclophilin family peptidyl-prolyl cis-trans isomerase